MSVKKGFLVTSLLILLSLTSCRDTETSIELAGETYQSMDGISRIPAWLQYEVANRLPSDSLNIWIPTGKLETSAMIRVPRFPTRIKWDNTNQKRFAIQLIDSLPQMLAAVKNEQVSVQVAVAAKQNIKALKATIEGFFSSTGEAISSDNIKIRYSKYIPVQRARSELIFTERPESIYGPEVSGFGVPDVVADPLLELNSVNVPNHRAQSIWITIKIPKETTAGDYSGKIKITTGNFKEKQIAVSIKVLDYTIPDAKDYQFFLDLWFNPNAIAVANSLELWSEKHWKLIGKYMEDLVSRGAKTITTTINQDPWMLGWVNGLKHSQTGIGYAPMIRWNLSKDGSWSYDYSIFDRYVALGLKSGLKERIDVFSLTPFEWEGKENRTYRNVKYFDEATGQIVNEAYQQFDEVYKAHWKRFLKDFEKHLRQKGWFEKTYLSFDENPKDVIESILETVREGAPDFLNRFSIAGKPITSELAQSLSIAYVHFKPKYFEEKPAEDLLAERETAGKTTTMYLYGEPAHPNTFTFSPAIESRMVPWLALKMGVDGYLRWAYNSWSDADPYMNPVFNYIQGDDYYVYPGKEGPVSSIRWELLKEGVEDFELFNVVKEKGKVSKEMQQEAIEVATRHEDGRNKNINDFNTSRYLILKSTLLNSSNYPKAIYNTNIPPLTN